MSHASGRKIVGVAMTAIAGTIGIGVIYLPFIADRDKLRGLFEEEEMPQQARKEIEMIMKAEQASQQAQRDAVSNGGHGNSNANGKKAGSMWQNMKKNAS